VAEHARRPDDLWLPPGDGEDLIASRDGGGVDGEGGAGGPGRWGWSLSVSAGDLLAGLICLLAMVAVGPLLGLLWAASAPHLDVRAVLAGSEAAFGAQGDIDAYFGLICMVGGVVGGLLALWRGRDAAWPVPVGLTIGGLGGSLLAGVVGHAVRGGGVRHQLPAGAGSYVISLVDFRVRSHGLYAVMPAVAVLVLTIGLWVSTRTGRRQS
jgi:hypothetical protein